MARERQGTPKCNRRLVMMTDGEVISLKDLPRKIVQASGLRFAEPVPTTFDRHQLGQGNGGF